jgi:hypothetical protein
MPFSDGIYNSVALGPDGNIWGLASSGIFLIDTETNGVSLIAQPPKPITAGFAMSGRTIYFVCGPELWHWRPR